MLRPESRSLMLENFRPPPGYQLNRAVGTTFTLDLMSLLTAPLAFTFFDWEDADGRPSTDPLALLQAVREHASRIHLFCQAGEIQLPPTNQPLLAYLEESVVPVRAPNANGIFHPKVWVLRYVGDPDMPVRYRLLCMSRNLTFSRSWDTALVLDGVLKNRHLAIARNHPIGDFLQALPGMAVRAAAPEIQATLDMMQEEVRRVNFELPENFHELSFWPIGHRGEGGWPFRQVENSRFLVMSPFLSTTFMRRLHKASRIEHLISRPEALAALPPAALKAVESCWAMSPGSDFDSHEGADEPVDPVAHGAGVVADPGPPTDPDVRVLPHPAPRQMASLRAVAYPLVQEARRWPPPSPRLVWPVRLSGVVTWRRDPTSVCWPSFPPPVPPAGAPFPSTGSRGLNSPASAVL